tara:strand:+ start:2042 stop:2482 length:441 start_codon:yes stop_codon:yes gene_type:complete
MTNRVLSIEDGNLEQSFVVSKVKTFSDIDVSFTAKPNGEIYKKMDAAAVKQSVKNIVLTNHFEKPFQPYFGGNVSTMLFEMADGTTTSSLKRTIKDAIESYEPRALVQEINVNSHADYNTINVTIVFQVVNSREQVTLSTTLSRLR